MSEVASWLRCVTEYYNKCPPVNPLRAELEDGSLRPQEPLPLELLSCPPRELRRKHPDGSSDDRSATPVSLDVGDRGLCSLDAATPSPLERTLKRKRKPLLPEDGSELANRARDLPVVTVVERERDETEAGMADSDLVDVKVESGGELVYCHSRIAAQEQ